MPSFSRSFTRITINGQTYHSVEEMPPEIRQQYEMAMAKIHEDTNNNGIPDIAEKSDGTAKTIFSYTRKDTDITQDLGPQLRQRVRAALDKNPAPSPGITIQLTLPTLIGLCILISVLAAIGWWLTHS